MQAAVWKELLEADGVAWTAQAEEGLRKYLGLLREWNRLVSLVSHGDLERLEEVHVPDSLSLAGWVKRCCEGGGVYLDVGSGGGFPAMPVVLALEGLRTVMVERSERKVGFLRKVLGALKLSRIQVVCGEFPRVGVEGRVGVMTARAVERPGKLAKGIGNVVRNGGVFLCQSDVLLETLSDGFHVERVEDAWGEQGIRRGKLHLIRAISSHRPA